MCAGMGGSGVVCHIMFPFYPFETQLKYADTLVAISNSGETRETLDVVRIALDEGLNVVGITGNPNSTLATLLRSHNHPVITHGVNISTRFVFPFLFTPLVKMVRPDLLSDLLEGASYGDPSIVTHMIYPRLKEDRGLRYPVRYPVFYASDYYGVAIRFKQEFNENAKLASFYGVIPEITHNEVEVVDDMFLPVVFASDSRDLRIASYLNAVTFQVNGIRDIPVLVQGAGLLTVKLAQERSMSLDIPRIKELKRILQPPS